MPGVDVNSESLIPESHEYYLVNIFKNTKVSFIVLLIVVISIYVAIFMLVGNNSDNDSISGAGKNIIVIGLEFLLWMFLIAIIYVNIKNYKSNEMDFQARIENLFNTRIAELSVYANNDASGSDTSGNDNGNNNNSNNNNGETGEVADSDETTNNCSSEDNSGKEVFHIAENKFTYEEAREMCNQYNSRLATYDEIENAYNNGANWCNYGWSEDQMAFFPTQKKVYNDLKKIPGHANDCGRPGVNGGYFENPNIKFGVNCYGVKPDAKEIDEQYMHAINHSPALSDEELNEANQQNNAYKDYIIAPFNKNKWTAL